MAKRRKKSTVEQTFQKEILHSIPRGAFYYKIPDTPVFKNKKTGMRFVPKKPVDWICIYAGNTFVVENKVHKSQRAWPLKNIAEHQIQSLLMAYENDFEKCENTKFAYVFLNLRYGRGKARVNYLLAMHIIPFMLLYHKFRNSKRESIPLSEFSVFEIDCRIESEIVTTEDGRRQARWRLGEFFQGNLFHVHALAVVDRMGFEDIDGE